VRLHRLLAIVILLAVAGGVATTAMHFWRQGYRVYIIHTGSMDPTFRSGGIVIDRTVTGTLHVGEPITFRHSALTPDVVTHRIKRITKDGIYTKGDANPTRDPWVITAGMVQGRVVHYVPKLGFVMYFLKQRAGIAALMTGFLSLIILWGLFFPAQVANAAAAAVALTGVDKLRRGPKHRAERGSAVRALRTGGAAARP
jgi:signal peptidase